MLHRFPVGLAAQDQAHERSCFLCHKSRGGSFTGMAGPVECGLFTLRASERDCVRRTSRSTVEVVDARHQLQRPSCCEAAATGAWPTVALRALPAKLRLDPFGLRAPAGILAPLPGQRTKARPSDLPHHSE